MNKQLNCSPPKIIWTILTREEFRKMDKTVGDNAQGFTHREDVDRLCERKKKEEHYSSVLRIALM